MAKGKRRAFSADSREDQTVAEVCLQNPAWDLRVELDGSAITWNFSIRKF